MAHAEKGHGSLTDAERRRLVACPQVRLVTIPDGSFCLPGEHPERVAELAAALAVL